MRYSTIRLFWNVCVFVSIFLLTLTLVAFLAGYVFTPWDYALSLDDSFHIGVWSKGPGSRLIIFNHREYGPYRGSIIGLVGEDGKIYPPLKHEEAIDGLGIYYRYFHWRNGSKLWTLMISLWYSIFLFSVAPIIWLLPRRRARRQQTHGDAGI